MTDKTEIQAMVDRMMTERFAVLADLKAALAHLPPEIRLFEVLKHLKDNQIKEITTLIRISEK